LSLLLPASVGIIGTQRFGGGVEIEGTQFRYVIKFVSDMNKAVKFYRDILGLRLKFESPGWSEFVTGETTLALPSASDKNPAERSNWASLLPMSRLSTGT
jgi:hypothetical protein